MNSQKTIRVLFYKASELPEVIKMLVLQLGPLIHVFKLYRSGTMQGTDICYC